MNRSMTSVLTRWACMLALGVAGCQKPASKPAGQGGDTGQSGAAEASAEDKIAKALAELSAEDRAAAEKQKVCPVSGEPLGAMGAPIKLTVADREVFICCKGCQGDLEADPEKFLAKLKQ